MTKKYPK
jgi:serine/threonine protein kinase